MKKIILTPEEEILRDAIENRIFGRGDDLEEDEFWHIANEEAQRLGVFDPENAGITVIREYNF